MRNSFPELNLSYHPNAGLPDGNYHYPADEVEESIGAWAHLDREVALEQARQWMLANVEAAKEFLANGGVPPVVINALIKTVPNTLVPDIAGIELLIEQRQRLYPNDVDGIDYQTLVDKRVL